MDIRMVEKLTEHEQLVEDVKMFIPKENTVEKNWVDEYRDYNKTIDKRSTEKRLQEKVVETVDYIIGLGYDNHDHEFLMDKLNELKEIVGIE